MNRPLMSGAAGDRQAVIAKAAGEFEANSRDLSRLTSKEALVNGELHRVGMATLNSLELEQLARPQDSGGDRQAVIAKAAGEFEANRRDLSRLTSKEALVNGELHQAGMATLNSLELEQLARPQDSGGDRQAVIAKAAGEFEANRRDLSRLTSKEALVNGELHQAGHAILSDAEKMVL